MKRLKRLLWIPLLFLCSTLWAADSCEPIQLARMNPYIAGAGVAAACTSCTGGVIFAAYFEAAGDGDVTKGTPCGCSVNDTTGTAASEATITGGYMDIPTTADYYQWDVSSDDIFKGSAGSVLIEFQVATWVDLTELWSVYVDTNNLIYIRLANADDLNIVFKGSAGSTNISATSAALLTTDVTYYAVGRWTSSDVDPNSRIEVYDASSNLIKYAVDNTNTGAITGAGSGSFKVGNRTSNEGEVRIYKIKVWDTYSGAPTTNLSAE